MTNAEKFAADQVAAQARANAVVEPVPYYAPPVVDPVVEPVPVSNVPFAVMSDDIFHLVDTNNDGRFDTVIVKRVSSADAAKVVDAAKYASYHAGIAAVSEAAYRAHRGSSTVEVEAAQNIAVAKFKSEYTGEVPAQTQAEQNAEVAKATAAAEKAAQAAEVMKLSAV